MNKKGFTLIELLAAVSVLALLVVIIIPSVTDLYNDAKKNVFVNECRNIYKSARSSYVYDNVRTSEAFAYGSGIDNNGSVQLKELKLSGDNKMTYLVQFDNEGNIIYFFATDGNYELEQGEVNIIGDPISINDIDEGNATEVPDTGGNGGTGSTTITVEEPTEPGDDGGQITPFDPGYDPDDPDNPDDPFNPGDPIIIDPITPGSLGGGEDLEYTVTQTTISNTNSCPKKSGYVKSQSGNDIVVRIYFTSNLGNPSYSIKSVKKDGNVITVNAKTTNSSVGGADGITMMKCTLLTVTINNENINESTLKVMNGLVEMGIADFEGSGQSTY